MAAERDKKTMVELEVVSHILELNAEIQGLDLKLLSLGFGSQGAHGWEERKKLMELRKVCSWVSL